MKYPVYKAYYHEQMTLRFFLSIFTSLHVAMEEEEAEVVKNVKKVEEAFCPFLSHATPVSCSSEKKIQDGKEYKREREREKGKGQVFRPLKSTFSASSSSSSSSSLPTSQLHVGFRSCHHQQQHITDIVVVSIQPRVINWFIRIFQSSSSMRSFACVQKVLDHWIARLTIF